MHKLKLNVRQIKGLQEKHGIPNLLMPAPEEAAKMANVDFLTDFCYEGSRSWEPAPSRGDLEEFDLSEMIEAFQGYMNPGKKGAAGNG
jgi:hypothetical protein